MPDLIPGHARGRFVAFIVMATLLALAYNHAKAQTYDVHPGDNVQSILTSKPEGATIRFAPGLYPFTTFVNPKPRQVLEGDGATFSGARTLTDWKQDSAGRWYVEGQTQEGRVIDVSGETECWSGWRCTRPEDVFFNRKPQKHVTSINALAAGTFFFDYDANRIYVGSDPRSALVQTSVTPYAIFSGNEGVTVRGFVIEMFAAPTQDGALQSNGNGWLIENVTATLNHGCGALLRGNTRIRGLHASNNGQCGLKLVGLNNGQANDTVVEPCFAGINCTIDRTCELNANNYAGHNPAFEAGNKFVRTTNLIVRGCVASYNVGKGLWPDINNIDVLIENNVTDYNTVNGIFHEISKGAIIRGNTARYNGSETSNEDTYWAGIVITNSPGTQQKPTIVENNLIIVGARGNALGVRRDCGRAGETEWITVRNNTVVFEAAHGQFGLEEYGGSCRLGSGIVFEGNDFFVVNAGYPHFYAGGAILFNQWQQRGYDVTGSLTVGIPATATYTPSRTATLAPFPATLTPTWTLTPTATETPEMTPTPLSERRFVIEIIIKEFEP